MPADIGSVIVHVPAAAAAATLTVPEPLPRNASGTPAAIVNKLHQETVKVLGQPDMRARFSQMGLDTVGNTPNELAAIVRSDVAKWTKVIKDAGITATD